MGRSSELGLRWMGRVGEGWGWGWGLLEGVVKG